MAEVKMPKLPNNSGNPYHDGTDNLARKEVGEKIAKPQKEGIVKSAAREVVNDVFIPAAKQTFVNGVNSVLDIAVGSIRNAICQSIGIDIGSGQYGRYSNNSPYRAYNGGQNVNYSSYSQEPRANYIRSSVNDYKDIVKFRSRVDAELVLDKLGDSIAQYGRVPVRELYEYARKQTLAIDQDWGWTDISTASTYSTFDGQWKLSLPPLESLR